MLYHESGSGQYSLNPVNIKPNYQEESRLSRLPFNRDKGRLFPKELNFLVRQNFNPTESYSTKDCFQTFHKTTENGTHYSDGTSFVSHACNEEEGHEGVQETVSEGCISQPRISHNREIEIAQRFSEHAISPDREERWRKHSTNKKKIVCKYCSTSKQFGSCPCPIHLPTIQSRYMRVLQDNTRNAITINVFKNGDYRVTPTMITIPKFYMRSMEEIMKIVDKFIRFPIGYAHALYTLLGDLVDEPAELEPYEMYVVVNNCKKQFVPIKYGSKRPYDIKGNRRRRAIPHSKFALTPFIRV